MGKNNNNLIARTFAFAGIPTIKEPQGLSRSDGKRPDGLTLIPWQAGKAVTWNVTVVCLLADSYILTVAQDAGAIAELARKTAKSLRWKVVTFLPRCMECRRGLALGIMSVRLSVKRVHCDKTENL